MSKTFYQMTDCKDGAGGAGAWIPADYFVDLVLEGVVAYGDLSGRACTIALDLAAGNGDNVNVRTVTKRSHTNSCITCGECLSSTSNTFGDVAISVCQYGDYDKIAAYADWQAQGDIVKQVAKEMSKRMANTRDTLLWTALCAATPNTTLTLQTAWSPTRLAISSSCCSFGFDIYNTIVDARQHLMGDGYEPDYVLIHPYVSAYLYYKEGAGGNAYPFQQMPLLKFGSDGYLASVAGLKVIEVRVAVADDSSPSDTGDELAFVIDSRRALAEVWGMRPKFYEDFDVDCNATELVLWNYWGCDTVDDNAIVEINSP